MNTRDAGNPVDFDHLKTLVDDLLSRAREGHYPAGLLSAVSPAVTEVLALQGFDYIIVNQEHAINSGSTPLITEHLRCATIANLPAFVKLPLFSPLAARDALDAGAIGLQVPFVNSAQMLRDVFDACRFPPYGHRGLCVAPRAAWWATPAPGDVLQVRKLLDFSNNHLVIVAMIETEEGMNNLDEILEVPGLQVVGLGPIDLALSLGIAEEHLSGDPEAGAMLGHALGVIIDKAHAAGKLVMGPASFSSHESQIAALGIDLPYYGETQLMQYGADEMRRRKQVARDYHVAKHGDLSSLPRAAAK